MKRRQFLCTTQRKSWLSNFPNQAKDAKKSWRYCGALRRILLPHHLLPRTIYQGVQYYLCTRPRRIFTSGHRRYLRLHIGYQKKNRGAQVLQAGYAHPETERTRFPPPQGAGPQSVGGVSPKICITVPNSRRVKTTMIQTPLSLTKKLTARRTKTLVCWKRRNPTISGPSWPAFKPWCQRSPCSNWHQAGDNRDNRAARGNQARFITQLLGKRKVQHLTHGRP